KQKQQVAKTPMDRAKIKAQKQKRLAIILSGVLLLVLVYEVPHTLKLMKKSPSAVVVSSAGAAPALTPTQTTAIPGGPPSRSAAQQAVSTVPTIVASVQATPDPGQLSVFTKFASKDPFDASVEPRSGGDSTGGSSGSGPGSTPTGSTPSGPAT